MGKQGHCDAQLTCRPFSPLFRPKSTALLNASNDGCDTGRHSLGCHSMVSVLSTKQHAVFSAPTWSFPIVDYLFDMYEPVSQRRNTQGGYTAISNGPCQAVSTCMHCRILEALYSKP